MDKPRKKRISKRVNSNGDPRPSGGNKTGTPPKTGRPCKEINQKSFENLCFSQCTQSEICAVLDADWNTITRWCKRTYKVTFAEAQKKYSENGKAGLRRTQLKMAEKSAAMAIWCGKQYLGQVDHDRNQTESINQAARDLISAADKIAGIGHVKPTQPEAN